MGNVKLHEKVLQVFERYGKVPHKQCESLKIDKESCNVLNRIIRDGLVEDYEKPPIRTEFVVNSEKYDAEEFIEGLAGPGGNRPLSRFIKWQGLSAYNPKADEKKQIYSTFQLKGYGPSLRYDLAILFRMLAIGSVKERIVAVYILGTMGLPYDGGKIPMEFLRAGIEKLIQALKDPDPNVRAAATYSLSWLVDDAPDAIREAVYLLIPLLEDRDYRVRKNSLVTLNKIAETWPTFAKSFISMLPKLFSDEHYKVRLKAVEAVESLLDNYWDEDDEIYAAAKMLISHLIKALGDPHPKVAEKAVSALSFDTFDTFDIPPTTIKAAAPLLKKLLRSKKMRAIVAFLIADFAEVLEDEAKAVVPILIKLTKNKKDVNKRTNAIIALSNIASSITLSTERIKSIITTLSEALVDKDPDVRAEAADAFGNIAEESDVDLLTIVPKLIKSSSDPDEHVRYWAVGALGHAAKYEKFFEQIKKLLTKKLTDSNEEVRHNSLNSLHEIAEKRPSRLKTIFPIFVSTLDSKYPDVQTNAAFEIGLLADEAAINTIETAIPTLMKLLGNKALEDRENVVYALGQIAQLSPDLAEKINPTLQKALTDPDEDVREEAAEMLEEIN